MKSWKDWFQPHILERGRAYFDEGRVSALERTEDMLCDCPYAEDGNILVSW